MTTSIPITITISSNHNGPVRILPLGDSITQAKADGAGHDSYRRSLWQMLQSQGYNVDFVGSLTTTHNGPPPNQDFDLDHEGHWGWRADEIINGGGPGPTTGKLSDWLQGYTPDIVLLHLGTNDLIQMQTVSSTVSELKQIIDIFTVPITDDLLDENDEAMTLSLSNPVSATLSPPNDSATLTIIDNDENGSQSSTFLPIILKQ